MKIKIRDNNGVEESTMYVNGKKVEDPKQKRNAHIFIMCFLSFFVVALLFGLVMIIRQSTNPGDFVFTTKEEVHVDETTYSVKIIDRVNNGTPTKFEVWFSTNGSAIPQQTVTDFTTTTKKGVTTYTFSVQILGELWDDVHSVSRIVMYTEEGEFMPEQGSAGENIWVAYIVIGVFIIVLSALIVYNGKLAATEHRRGKKEIEDKITATQRAVAKNNNSGQEGSHLANPNTTQAPSNLPDEDESLKLKCPYCGTTNKFSDSRCSNCNAPLR